MLYVPSQVNVVIHAKDIDTSQIIKRDLYRGPKSPGDNFNESVDNVITVDGIGYSKIKNFDYLYLLPNGSQKKVYSDSGTDNGSIRFQVPTEIKVPSKCFSLL